MDWLTAPGAAAATRTAARSRNPWAGLTWKHFALAVGAGLMLGCLQGAGALLRTQGLWWAILGDIALPTIAFAVFLLLALTAAARVEVTRVPHWVPYAVAVFAATALSAACDWAIGRALAALADETQEPEMQLVWMYVWTFLPEKAILAVFAAFAAMQAMDAGRRNNALRGVQLERVRMAREAYEARLVALQARVEPSFLFETLSDIEALYERDPEAGARVLDDLIVYLRAALPAIEEPSSSLAAEIRLARTWLDIMRIRSGERLTFAIADPAPGLDARMPPMVLLPLVQQAALDDHGAERAVLVSAAIDGANLRVTVTGPGPVFAPSANTPAIDAIRERLAILYADETTLTLHAVSHNRSQATLEIPHERTDRDHR